MLSLRSSVAVSRTALTLLAILASLALLCAAAGSAVAAEGYIKVKKGGDRVAGNTTNTGYAAGLSGAVFEYQPVSASIGDAGAWQVLCTTGGTGECTGPAAPGLNGAGSDGSTSDDYRVRERTAPTGWTKLTTLWFDDNDNTPDAARDYISVVDVDNNTTREAGFPDQSNPSTAFDGTDRSASPFLNARDNVVFPDFCGINLLLVLDRSGSTDPYKTQFRDAAKALVQALDGTPTQIGITSFSDSVNSYQGPVGNANYYNAPLSLNGIAPTTNRATLEGKINNIYSSPSGGTDWDAALQNGAAAQGFTGAASRPDVVVFLTDGNPTTRDTAGADAGSAVNLIDLTAGIASANLVKSQAVRSTKVKMFALGVGSGVTAENLEVVSGPTENEDYSATSVDGVKAKLQEIAARTCGARIKVRKKLLGAGDDNLARADWAYTASAVQTVSYSDPDAAAPWETHGSPAELTISLNNIPEAGTSATVLENTSGQPEANFTLTSVVCRTGGYDEPNPVVGSDVANGKSLTGITRGSQYFCTFTNARKGSVQLKKYTSPTQANGFDLSVNGASSGDGFANNAGNNGQTPNPLYVSPGSVTIAETGDASSLSDYDIKYRCVQGASFPTSSDVQANGTVSDGSESVAVAAGESWKCAFLNTRKGTVQVTKYTTPAQANGFDLKVGATTVAANVGNSGTGTTSVSPASGIIVSEAGNGSALADYDSKHLCQQNSVPTSANVASSGTTGTSTSINVAAGENWKCAFLNVRKGTLKLVKDFTGPAEGGAQVQLVLPGSSPLNPTVMDNGETNAVTVAGGSTTGVGENQVTGTDLSDYGTPTISCSAGGTAGALGGSATQPRWNVTVAAGANVTCTITNARKTGTVKLVKDIVPNSDGGRFNLRLDGVARDVAGGTGSGTPSFGDLSESAAIVVPTGVHAVDELAIAPAQLGDYDPRTLSCNYAGSGAPADTDGSFTVGEGQAWTCTFTNTRKGSLKVVKDFTGQVDPAHTVTLSNGGTDTTGLGDGGQTPVKTYTAGSAVVFGEAFTGGALASQYSASAECRDQSNAIVANTFTNGALSGSVTLGAGKDVTCTITNARRTGKLEVTKTLAPASDPGRFDLGATGPAGSTPLSADAVGDGGSTGAGGTSVPTGDWTPSEAADGSSPTGLGDYDTTLLCYARGDANKTQLLAGGDVTVGAGDDVVCEYTNTRKATLQLEKDFTGPAEPGAQAQLVLPGSSPLNPTVGDGGQTSVVTVSGGSTTSIGEDEVAGTSLSSYDTPTVACSAGGTAGSLGGTATQPRWDVTVSPGASVLCKITNARKSGTIKLKKLLTPATDDGRFNLKLDGIARDVAGSNAPDTPDAFGDSDETAAITVETGGHSVAEAIDDNAPPGRTLDNYVRTLSCNYAGSGAPADTDGAFDVAEGQDWTCVFTNVRKATVEIEKQTTNGGTDLFAFTSDLSPNTAGDPTSFNLADNGVTSFEVAPGSYTATEGSPSGNGYRLQAVSCSDAGDQSGQSTGTLTNGGTGGGFASISAQAGETVRCTFQNKFINGIAVTVKEPPEQSVYYDGTASFTYTVENTGTSDLTNVGLVDDKCSPLARGLDNPGDNDNVLEPGEKWAYSCSIAASHALMFQGQQNNPNAPAVRNTVTMSATDENGNPVGSSDFADTYLLVPKLSVDKTVAVTAGDVNTAPADGAFSDGPSYAKDGDKLWYHLAVTNTGNVNLTPELTDANCDLGASPTPVGKSGGDSDGDFEPGETWTYECTHVYASGDAHTYVNTVNASDDVPGTSQDPSDDDSVSTLRLPRVDVVKTVVNDNGGNAQPGDFTITVDGEDVTGADLAIPDSDPADVWLESTGEGFDASETPITGYTQTGESDGSGDPLTDCLISDAQAAQLYTPGVIYTCVVTNDDIAPKLKVVKSLVNGSDLDSGPDVQENDFQMTIAQAGKPDITFAGSAAGTTSDVFANLAYAVTEQDNPGEAGDYTGLFDTTYSSECTGTLDEGSTGTTCTVTNRRRLGEIKVVKQVVDGVPNRGAFNLKIEGDNQIDAGDADEVFEDDDASAFVKVGTGDYDLSEAAADAASALSNYDSSVVCENVADGNQDADATSDTSSLANLTVTADDRWVCTFTNTRKGSLKVVKDFDGPFDPAHTVTLSNGGTDTTGLGDGGQTPVKPYSAGSSVAFGETFTGGASAGQYTASAECRDQDGALVADSFTNGALSGNVTIGAGKDVTCTITNVRKTSRIKVVKDIVPVDSQKGDPGSFDLQIDGSTEKAGAIDGESTPFVTKPTGDHTVGELGAGATDLDDYIKSAACLDQEDDPVDATGSGTPWTVDLAADKDVTCTITNERKKGQVTLVKDIVPVDGQIGDPGRFDLEIDGEGAYDAALDEAGDGGQISITVPNGSVDLSESADGETSLTDYTSAWACVEAGDGPANTAGEGTSITGLPVNNGDEWTCTITNTRKQGQVTLIKDIVPVDGQIGDPGKFDLTIDGEGAYNATLDEAGDGGQTSLTVPNGTVDLSESADGETDLSDYSSTWACVETGEGPDDVSGIGTAIDDLPVNAGDEWTCTITNTRKKGTVTLIKDIVPVDGQIGDPGKFDLTIDGEGAYNATLDEAGDGGQTSLTVPNGTVDLSESADGETSLSDYTSSYSCVEQGEGPDDVSGNGTSIADLPVGAGDEWTCTITNTRKKGTVTLIKDIVPVNPQVPDPGKFDLLIDGEGAYDATADEAGDGGQTSLTVPNGNVDLSESADGETDLGDYTSTWACVEAGDGPADANGNGTSIADLPVNSGDEWTCTITNTRKSGQVTLGKVIVSVDEQLPDQGLFDLTIDGEGANDRTEQNQGDGDSFSLHVPNGTVDLSESAGDDTSLADYNSSYSCVNSAEGSTDDPVTGSGTTIAGLEVTAGDIWTCTFTNERKKGEVTVVKALVPTTDDGRFDLAIDGPGGHDATGDERGHQGSVTRFVPTGTVNVGESADGETSLSDYDSSYECANGAEGSEDQPLSGSGTGVTGIVVSEGDDWVCTFTNTRKGTLRIVKDFNEPFSGDDQVAVYVDGGRRDVAGSDPVDDTFADGDTTTAMTVSGGSEHSFGEAAAGETDLSLYNVSAECVDADAPQSEQPGVDAEEQRLWSVTVPAGANVVCTITNERKTGTIELRKEIDPGTDETTGFKLRLDGDDQLVQGSQSTDFGDGDSTGEITVPTGGYTVGEGGASELLNQYVTGAPVCTVNEDGLEIGEGTDTGAAAGTVGSFQLDEGQEVVCTWTNVKKPKLIVDKVVTPDDERPLEQQDEFTFRVSGDPQTTFGLRDDSEPREMLLTPGDYSVREDDPYAMNYKFSGAVCEQLIADEQGIDERSNETGDEQRTRAFTAQPGDVITCTFTNEKLTNLTVVAKSPKTQAVYLDQQVTYTYEVGNTGTSDLTDVTVSDDKCPGPAVRGTDKSGDNDAVLEPGEVWTYSCTVAASALFPNTSVTQVVNTVTVNAKDQAGQNVGPVTDTAVTTPLVPGIAIDKTGPATATAGDLVTYDLAVTNTGNTSFAEASVKPSDTVLAPSGLSCVGGVTGPSKGADQTPAELNPGETWTYQCKVQTAAGQTLVNNKGDVSGTDKGGKTVTASDTAQTTLNPAAIVTEPTVAKSGRARLTGSVGCVSTSYARATITGTSIRSVTFYVNGKAVKRLTKPNRSNNRYELRYRTRSLKYGVYKVTARVRFQAGTTPSSRDLKLQFSRCRPKIVRPTFTG